MKSLVVIAWLTWAFIARAELREWASVSGSTTRAEFQSRRMDEVQLKNEKGATLRVPFDQLSDADRVYVQLHQPPTLEVSVDPNRNFVDDSVTRRGEKNGYEVLDFEIVLARKSRESYDLPMRIDLYVIGVTEVSGSYVVVQRATRHVTFSATRNKHVVKAESLSLERTEATTSDEAAYAGYVALIRDQTGGVLEIKSNKPFFKTNALNLKDAREGTVLRRESLKPRK